MSLTRSRGASYNYCTSLYIFELGKFVRKNLNLFSHSNDQMLTHNLRSRNKLISTFAKLEIVKSGNLHILIKVWILNYLIILQIEKMTGIYHQPGIPSYRIPNPSPNTRYTRRYRKLPPRKTERTWPNWNEGIQATTYYKMTNTLASLRPRTPQRAWNVRININY